MIDWQAIASIANAISSMANAAKQGIEAYKVIHQAKVDAIAREERRQEQRRRRLRKLQLRLRNYPPRS